eukprot:GHUV01026612.1.p1 GENE.GHUV01026612.1~~GHUV01026612.1.p1  ORF type:complete len:226 (+),score=39.81 GHUV01026612.1:359-1036(+)
MPACCRRLVHMQATMKDSCGGALDTLPRSRAAHTRGYLRRSCGLQARARPLLSPNSPHIHYPSDRDAAQLRSSNHPTAACTTVLPYWLSLSASDWVMTLTWPVGFSPASTATHLPLVLPASSTYLNDCVEPASVLALAEASATLSSANWPARLLAAFIHINTITSRMTPRYGVDAASEPKPMIMNCWIRAPPDLPRGLQMTSMAALPLVLTCGTAGQAQQCSLCR